LTSGGDIVSRKRLMVSLTPDEYEKLVKIAKEQNRTLSNVVNTVIKKYLEEAAK
jgi:predicted DNA-binding protein